MPVNPKLYPASKRAVPSLFPSFSSNSEAKEHLARYPAVWEKFLKFPAELQEELLGFCLGEHGLKITYDPVFQRGTLFPYTTLFRSRTGWNLFYPLFLGGTCGL